MRSEVARTLSTLSANPKPTETPRIMKVIRFGLIGYGAWGAHHARAIAGNPQARLAAIAAHSDASQTAARDAHPSAADRPHGA